MLSYLHNTTELFHNVALQHLSKWGIRLNGAFVQKGRVFCKGICSRGGGGICLPGIICNLFCNAHVANFMLYL